MLPRARVLILLAALVLALGVGGAVAASHFLRQPAPLSPALRGEALARSLGCFGCHGPEGRAGIADPSVPGGVVPAWDGPTVGGYVRDDAELREWILDGAPARLRQSPVPGSRSTLLPMPAYRGRISDRELEDLVAYFNAVSGGTGSMPEAPYEGRRIAVRLGCFGCHGPSGIGGCPNPGSFKGVIPAWDGHDFAELVRDDAELREWILDGHPKRLWDNPAARHFLEGQVVKMPPYRAHLTEDETAKLVAYIRWLRRNVK